MVTSHRTALLAATGALITLAAGCGGDPGQRPSSPVNVVNADSSSTRVDRAAFVSDLLTAIDRYDTVHLSVRAGTMGSGEVDVSYAEEPSLIHVDANSSLRGPSQFVIADGVVYVEQSQGGQWLMIDQDDPSYGTLLQTFTKIGPRESVVGLGRGINAVTRTGTRTVDGTDLASYRLEVDPTLATGAFKALAGTSGISETLVFTFLLDETDLLRRIEVDVAGETTTVDLTAWGTPVLITVPSGDELITS